jgi:mono/diheme cytochrome c family protein
MRRRLPDLAIAAAVIFEMTLLAGQTAPPAPTSQTGNAVARGKYIVEDVAMCGFCHTPRNARGEPDVTRALLGGPVILTPALPSLEWAQIAPRLAGAPPGTDEQFIKLLTTGIARTGRPPRLPMKQFHMTRADAEAVLAYLKSLQP